GRWGEGGGAGRSCGRGGWGWCDAGARRLQPSVKSRRSHRPRGSRGSAGSGRSRPRSAKASAERKKPNNVCRKWQLWRSPKEVKRSLRRKKKGKGKDGKEEKGRERRSGKGKSGRVSNTGRCS